MVCNGSQDEGMVRQGRAVYKGGWRGTGGGGGGFMLQGRVLCLSSQQKLACCTCSRWSAMAARARA